MSALPVPPSPRYQLLHPLGSGGMGDVYAAHDETLQRRVALKAIHADRRLDEASRERFLHEARLLSRLDHPNICRAYDYVQGDEADWLVMELVEGRSVIDLLARGPMGPSILAIAEQVASVLVATHEAGIVHRDLKPGNVMVTHGGEVKVLDFGVARSGGPRPPAASRRADPVPASRPRDDDPEVTRPLPSTDPATAEADGAETHLAGRTASTGTLPYMSPEQARGEMTTPATDIFAFGLLLQEMITGRGAYPLTLDGITMLDRVRRGDAERFGDTTELAALVRRMLAVAPSQRPTAVEALARIRWIRDTPKRRLRRGAVAAGVVISVLAGVKYTVDLGRERNVAIAAEADANRRRGQAEDLIGFMLGDLRGRLEKAGRLDLLDAVGAQAMDYFAAVPTTSLSGEELSQRAQAIYQIGLVRQAQGNLQAARESFDESLRAATQLAARDPGNADWQLRLATAHFYAGDIRRRENDLTGAMREFLAYREIAAALSARDPANATWALEVAFAEGAVAAVQERQGDLPGAKRALESALAVKARLASAAPSDAARQIDLATGHNRLGLVLDKLGETDAARRHYEDDLTIRQSLVSAEPSNQALKRPLFTAINFVASASEDAGDLAAALAQYRAGRDVIAPLAASDVSNQSWQRDLGVVERQIGDVLRATGHGTEARTYYERARSILQPIAAAGSTDVTRQLDLARVELGLGRLALDRRETAAARSAAARVERLLAPPFSKRADLVLAAALVEARLVRAAAEDLDDHPDRAAGERRAALALAEAVPGPHNKRLRAGEALAKAGLGRRDEAQAILTDLDRLGYRHWLLNGAPGRQE